LRAEDHNREIEATRQKKLAQFNSANPRACS
jgi:hypothetical protein